MFWRVHISEGALVGGQSPAATAGLFGNIPMAISFNPQLAALNMQASRVPQKEGTSLFWLGCVTRHSWLTPWRHVTRDSYWCMYCCQAVIYPCVRDLRLWVSPTQPYYMWLWVMCFNISCKEYFSLSTITEYPAMFTSVHQTHHSSLWITQPLTFKVFDFRTSGQQLCSDLGCIR